MGGHDVTISFTLCSLVTWIYKPPQGSQWDSIGEHCTPICHLLHSIGNFPLICSLFTTHTFTCNSAQGLDLALIYSFIHRHTTSRSNEYFTAMDFFLCHHYKYTNENKYLDMYSICVLYRTNVILYLSVASLYTYL